MESTAFLERDANNGFRMTRNDTLGSVLHKKKQVKRRKGPSYRKINTYFKSIKQHKKERERRKKVLHLWMIEFLSQKEIAAKLDVSVSTVKRDQRKLRRYVRGQNNRAIRMMREERERAFEQAMEGLGLRERFDYLSLQLKRQKELWKMRGYRGHYHIFHLDMTQPDEYGIPKLTMLPRQTANKPLAYPYKIRVVVKATFEGKTFETTLGGFDIKQTTRYRW